jgi:hypothetical protein
LRIDILSCVFDLLFFVLCTISCQYLWIVHLDCPFSISLAFIHAKLSTTNPCLLNILVYFYLIYQHLTTTSFRLHQRSNFKEPINDEPIILWGIEKNKSFWREEIISEKYNIHPHPPTQYSLYKYWVWIFENLWFNMQKDRVHRMIYQPIGSSNNQ